MGIWGDSVKKECLKTRGLIVTFRALSYHALFSHLSKGIFNYIMMKCFETNPFSVCGGPSFLILSLILDTTWLAQAFFYLSPALYSRCFDHGLLSPAWNCPQDPVRWSSHFTSVLCVSPHFATLLSGPPSSKQLPTSSYIYCLVPISPTGNLWIEQHLGQSCLPSSSDQTMERISK